MHQRDSFNKSGKSQLLFNGSIGMEKNLLKNFIWYIHNSNVSFIRWKTKNGKYMEMLSTLFLFTAMKWNRIIVASWQNDQRKLLWQKALRLYSTHREISNKYQPAHSYTQSVAQIYSTYFIDGKAAQLFHMKWCLGKFMFIRSLARCLAVLFIFDASHVCWMEMLVAFIFSSDWPLKAIKQCHFLCLMLHFISLATL